MKKVLPITCLAVLTMLNTACIHDDEADCRFGCTVEILVQDKNYENIGQFPQLAREDENQPFSHFSGTVYYLLTNGKTGQTIRESEVIPTAASGQAYPLVFENLPTGEYNLSVWGNLTSDTPAGILHPNGKEHTDVYTASAKFSITNKDAATQLKLKRAKGRLLIICSNFPDNIVRMHQSLTNIYGQTDAALNYSLPTTVEKDSAPLEASSLLVAPTPSGQTSQLSLSFYTENSDAPILTVPDVTLNIARNELSAVTVDYDSVSNLWNIWVYADGEWMLLHHLTIE